MTNINNDNSDIDDETLFRIGDEMMKEMDKYSPIDLDESIDELDLRDIDHILFNTTNNQQHPIPSTSNNFHLASTPLFLEMIGSRTKRKSKKINGKKIKIGDRLQPSGKHTTFNTRTKKWETSSQIEKREAKNKKKREAYRRKHGEPKRKQINKNIEDGWVAPYTEGELFGNLSDLSD